MTTMVSMAERSGGACARTVGSATRQIASAITRYRIRRSYTRRAAESHGDVQTRTPCCRGEHVGGVIAVAAVSDGLPAGHEVAGPQDERTGESKNGSQRAP